MAKLSRYQRDVLIKCNHGVTDGPAEYVSHYRFIASEDTWRAVDPGGTSATDVGPREVDDGWFPVQAHADGPRHSSVKVRCRRCGMELSITQERLIELLNLAAPADEPVTIAGLQAISRRVRLTPKRHE